MKGWEALRAMHEGKVVANHAGGNPKDAMYRIADGDLQWHNGHRWQHGMAWLYSEMLSDQWEPVPAEPPKCGDCCPFTECPEPCAKDPAHRGRSLHGHGNHEWSSGDAQNDDYWQRRAKALREDRDNCQHLADERWVAIGALERERDAAEARANAALREVRAANDGASRLLEQRDEARAGVIEWCKKYEALERELAAARDVRRRVDEENHRIIKEWTDSAAAWRRCAEARATLPQDWPIEALREGNELREKIDQLRDEATQREVSLSRRAAALTKARAEVSNLETALNCMRGPLCMSRHPDRVGYICILVDGHGGPNHANAYAIWPKAPEPDPTRLKVQG